MTFFNSVSIQKCQSAIWYLDNTTSTKLLLQVTNNIYTNQRTPKYH